MSMAHVSGAWAKLVPRWAEERRWGLRCVQPVFVSFHVCFVNKKIFDFEREGVAVVVYRKTACPSLGAFSFWECCTVKRIVSCTRNFFL